MTDNSCNNFLQQPIRRVYVFDENCLLIIKVKNNCFINLSEGRILSYLIVHAQRILSNSYCSHDINHQQCFFTNFHSTTQSPSQSILFISQLDQHCFRIIIQCTLQRWVHYFRDWKRLCNHLIIQIALSSLLLDPTANF